MERQIVTKIIQLYNEGYETYEIAIICKVSESLVVRVLESRGLIN